MDINFRKKFGLEEMMVHVPMCTHNNIKKVLVIGEINDNFKEQFSKHTCSKIVYSDTLIEDEIFDIILYTKQNIPTKEQMNNIQNSLEQTKGIFVCIGTFIYKDIERTKIELSVVGKDFWICMPYSFNHYTLIFASKKFHPQAEIILQISDLLPNCKYYNTEMQYSSFIYPQYITEEITGITKR
jgi:spermidine synthase